MRFDFLNYLDVQIEMLLQELKIKKGFIRVNLAVMSKTEVVFLLFRSESCFYFSIK